MQQSSQDVISEMLGCEPIQINSALVSAQNRERLYWTNLPKPEILDLNIQLLDVLENESTYLNKATILGRRLDERGKRQDYNKDIPITQCLEVRATNTHKSNCPFATTPSEKCAAYKQSPTLILTKQASAKVGYAKS